MCTSSKFEIVKDFSNNIINKLVIVYHLSTCLNIKVKFIKSIKYSLFMFYILNLDNILMKVNIYIHLL